MTGWKTQGGTTTGGKMARMEDDRKEDSWKGNMRGWGDRVSEGTYI
jgi:hypothetical protein